MPKRTQSLVDWPQLTDDIASVYGITEQQAQEIAKAVLREAVVEARDCAEKVGLRDPDWAVGARAVVARLDFLMGRWQ